MMGSVDPDELTLTETDVSDAIEVYKRSHPEVAEAMRVFNISNEAYQGAVEALYGPRVTWTNAANQAPQGPRSRS